MPANTGAARANHCGACFAGSPAPTSTALAGQIGEGQAFNAFFG